jgi:phosphotransferase system HPr (HPr) family protein
MVLFLFPPFTDPHEREWLNPNDEGFPVEHNGHAMNGEPLRTKVTITNPQGFHMRPQSAFAQLAAKFQSVVFLIDGENQKYDGKSPFSLLGLLAEQGTELILEVCGPDQDQALEALAHLIATFTAIEEENPETNSQNQ